MSTTKSIFKTAMTALLAVMMAFPVSAARPELGFARLWTHLHSDLGQTAEIPAFDALTNTVWVAGVSGVDVLDAPSGELLQHIDVTRYGYVNSVAIHRGLAALAVESPSSKTSGDRRNPGKVLFVDTRSRTLTDGGIVEVGALPDMLTFTHDGRYLLVANEGTPNQAADQPYLPQDPQSSVSIIDVGNRRVVAVPTLLDVPAMGSALRTPDRTGMDYEPEYISLSDDDQFAYVSLQEANGIAVLDMRSMQFKQVIGLGLKDFSLADNGFGISNYIDAADSDITAGSTERKRAQVLPIPVKGLYQPDAIASFRYGGKNYLAMANEGDTREDEVDKARASKLEGIPEDLKRLNISLLESSRDQLVAFGGRSFSIRDEDGNLVYDSGNLLDVHASARGIYDDARSDDKGVEPEGVAVMRIAGRTYAFVGLERTTKSAVAVFDITVPQVTQFVDMIVTEGDVAPEGLAAYEANGGVYLAIANEESNTTTLYRLDAERI